MLRSIYVKGEVSNLKYHSSGHIYFTLKDESGTLNCAMFASNRKTGLKFRMEEGHKIIAFGAIDVYLKDGSYRLYAREITLDGEGDLYVRFEQLKKELEEMGMFDRSYKKPIPRYIKTLGIVTAPTGAAIRDMIAAAKRRNPYVQLILYPALVQGEGAKESIVQGLKALESLNVDTIIVGRGGGSIEDLWAFNEEMVARAIFECSVPVISAVGHETDTTISDLVADLRAPTPSTAAELAIYEKQELMDTILDYRYSLTKEFEDRLTRLRNRLEKDSIRLKLKSPDGILREKRMYLLRAGDRLEERIKAAIKNKRHSLGVYVQRLEGVSPLKRLKSGYALVEAGGNVVTSETELSLDDELLLHMMNRDIYAVIKEIVKVERNPL